MDERLQFLDMVQDLLVSGSSRCPHMPPDSASFDTGMVSYLASSRFGPAILTTYAQKVCLPASQEHSLARGFRAPLRDSAQTHVNLADSLSCSSNTSWLSGIIQMMS